MVYVLRGDQRPTHPDRNYTGMVTKILPSGNEVLLTLTDAQYEGLSEPVEVAQIIRLEKRTATHQRNNRGRSNQRESSSKKTQYTAEYPTSTPV